MRYEKHRVWEVVGTLKENFRHVYGRRVFYIDEDTKGIVATEIYDGRGQLWRVQELVAVCNTNCRCAAALGMPCMTSWSGAIYVGSH